MKFSPSTNGFYIEAIHGGNIPSDSVNITNEEHAALLSGQSAGKTIAAGQGGLPHLVDPAPPTQEQVIAQYEAALDSHLDGVARQHRYDNRFTFALRAGYQGPYHDEAVSFAEWMDSCNAQSFALLSQVINGSVPMPTINDFIGSLPEFVYPQ